ncbi:MAG TPA: hypothetical protein ENN98_02195 [Desulfurivibrio alkaliphilus]|uniref:Permease n=1 Tax=Desulfurivibrio alkaliphilus TaxID=427923 RepID=A0A7C2XNP6_9BACT|nr:hypothetical protein [Desulfurivibrio alkaliphilus]
MEWQREWKPLALMVVVFLAVYHLPVGIPRFDNAIQEALELVRWYAREHVLLCLIPAFFIAGAIAVFVSQASVLKYLGAGANKVLAYGVASVSGTVLAVCSCTVLPLFAGIYRMGAGLGPAAAFLYAGPAINVLAIVLTARVLGAEMGIARAVAAIAFSIVIGLAMHWIFRKEEQEKQLAQAAQPQVESSRPLWQNALFFGAMIGILVFANWGGGEGGGFWSLVAAYRWWLTSLLALLLGIMLMFWFGLPKGQVLLAGAPALVLALVFPSQPTLAFIAGFIGLSLLLGRREDENGTWFKESWDFAKQILPLLLLGVLVAGLLLGRPGQEGLIPSEWVSRAVGDNSLGANFFASLVGAFMYFATLTEIPILQGLIGNGMHKGPALALLLAGPALSLPNMLVIRSLIGTLKTVIFIALVVVMATISGLLYGALF